MGARAMEMKKVYVTLMALFDVLEILVEQSPTDRLHRQILEEVIKIELMTTCLFLIVNDCCAITLYLCPIQIKRVKRSDAALRGELITYNIVPLDAPSSVVNIIGFFPEVRIFSLDSDMVSKT
ncbi:hypothetical protein HU200_016379 [Digitaria exilis]|uniref:Uncharacterized protein n=1 Tax=Digitaria exilis TaxID=1010633 RepID=A0A835KKZ2_9POAL|nr:hypothetical protein HU200_016379 [Digitaria exilis]